VVALAAPASQRYVFYDYEPVGAARDLILAKEPEVLAVGPAGTGKTLAACVKLHRAASRYPGARILMARKTLESLKSGALNTYINGIKPHLYNVETFGGNKFFPAEFRYENGSVILVSGMDKAEKILSAEFDLIYVNEATELTERDWETLKTRLRNGVMPYQQIIGDCNPNGPRHWLNLRCINGQTRRITSTHRDNPAYWDRRANGWTEQGRQYVQENLANLSGIARKRLFQGVWAAAEGLVYPEFTSDMVREVDVDGWRTVMGADIGSRNATAILTAHVSGDNRIHISREVYRRGMTSSDILAAIESAADMADPDAIYVDPSAAGYIGDLTRDGYPAVKATNDVLTGIQRVHGAFQSGLTIDRSCTNLIDELGMYAYPDNPRIETDKPVKEHDHACDALRYLVMGALEPTMDIEEWYTAWAS
jgi:PBSX family phage terminase large subunit